MAGMIVMSRYGISSVDKYSPGTFPDVGGQAQPQKFQNLVVGFTSIITPRFLNEFRTSYGRCHQSHQGAETPAIPSRPTLVFPSPPPAATAPVFVEGISLSNTAIAGLSGRGRLVPDREHVPVLRWRHVVAGQAQL